MKRTAIILISLLAAVASQAQISFGFLAGGGFNKVTAMEVNGQNVWDFKNILAPTVGVMASTTLGEKFDLQAELNYAMRGFKDRISVADLADEHQAEFKVRSSYLELPVLLKFYPVSRFNIQAGPQVGVLLGRSASGDNGLEDNMISFGKDKSLDFGLVFGVGFEEGMWSLDLRYYLGLTKTYDATADGLKNRGISLSVGYFLK